MKFKIQKAAVEPQSVFKALADPTRREILKLLQQRSMTAGEIAEAFDMTKGTLSHHFKILKEAELVRSETRAQQRVYSINTTVCEDAVAMVFDLFGALPSGVLKPSAVRGRRT
jgi:ArsR family transcriptional regulator